jgi:hypothetical protein
MPIGEGSDRHAWRAVLVALVALVALLALSSCSSHAGGAPAEALAAPTTVTTTPSTTTAGTSTSTSTSTTTTSITTTAVPTTAVPTTAATRRPRPAPVPKARPAETAPLATAPVETLPPATVPPETVAPGAGHRVFAVGDSVMLRAADALHALPGWDITVDAAVGRQFRTGIPLVAAASARGTDVVVIHLGTNGPFTPAEFEEMMTAAGGAKVVLVTVQLPDETYAHERPTNDMLREGAARWGATLVDWNGATNGHPEMLRPDGYHMELAAAPLYAGLIAAAL